MSVVILKLRQQELFFALEDFGRELSVLVMPMNDREQFIEIYTSNLLNELICLVSDLVIEDVIY